MRLTILKKVLLIMLVLTIIPLAVIGLLAVNDARVMGEEAAMSAKALGESNLDSAISIGELSVEESKTALENLAKESIEMRSVDAAQKIADFLYERDNDLMLLKELPQTKEMFETFIDEHKRDVDIDGNLIAKPIYKEVSLLDLNGNEIVSVMASGYDGKNFELEDLYNQIKDLDEDEIYVSNLWGDYVPVDVAYTGIERPDGQRYDGYFRWVTPVYSGNAKTGYLSMKLDSRHVMEFVDHIYPTEQRYTIYPDAPSGNYAYLVDNEGWLISHAREYHLKGVFEDGTLTIPLDKAEGAPAMRENSVPLQFGHLYSHSVELDEIHTVHALAGKSGSQVYPWAGLDKWIAYATVPYHTGQYSDPIGFGWIGVGAQIDTFYAPATATKDVIDAQTEEQKLLIESKIFEVETNIDTATAKLTNKNLVITLITILIVILVSYLFARSLSSPIKGLKEAADKVTDGEFDVTLPKRKSQDEISDLAASMEMLVMAFKMKSKKK